MQRIEEIKLIEDILFAAKMKQTSQLFIAQFRMDISRFC